jgi:hypothetical protein
VFSGFTRSRHFAQPYVVGVPLRDEINRSLQA